VKISAVLLSLRGELRERDAVNAPHPARQVALISEAAASGDFSQTAPPFANELDRALQPYMYDVTVRRDTDRASEYAGEMERAPPRNICQRDHIDVFVDVVQNIVPDALEHSSA